MKVPILETSEEIYADLGRKIHTLIKRELDVITEGEFFRDLVRTQLDRYHDCDCCVKVPILEEELFNLEKKGE